MMLTQGEIRRLRALIFPLAAAWCLVFPGRVSYWCKVCGVDREVHARAGREASATCSWSDRNLAPGRRSTLYQHAKCSGALYITVPALLPFISFDLSAWH